MSPLDRIAQLTAQLADAREQAARDSATISRLAAAHDELANQVNRWDAMLEHAERLEDTGMAYSCRNAIHNARQALAKTEGVTA